MRRRKRRRRERERNRNRNRNRREALCSSGKAASRASVSAGLSERFDNPVPMGYITVRVNTELILNLVQSLQFVNVHVCSSMYKYVHIRRIKAPPCPLREVCISTSRFKQ